MKQLSSAPIVILLDVLFIFLFILIIKESPPETKIILPETKLEKGGFLSHEYDDGKFVWYNPEFQMWSGSEEINSIPLHKRVGKFVLGIDCDKKCISLLKNRYDLGKYDYNIKVIITGDLYDNISRLTYLACQTNQKKCGNIIFRINENWEIDKAQLLKENAFLRNIPGIVENF